MYAKTGHAFKYFSSDLCCGSMVKRIECRIQNDSALWKNVWCTVLINLRTVIFEDTERDFFSLWNSRKQGPSFLSPSTNASFYTDLPVVLTFSVCPQNASAGHWNWHDRLGRESCCYVNSLALQKPLGTNKRRIFLVFPKICNRVCLTQ